jgi:hypothetical protein
MEVFLLMMVIHLLINLWLIVAAFTRSVMWGVLVLLFSPITAIAFGFAYFREVKLPFLLYLTTAVLAIITFVMLDQKEMEYLGRQTGLISPAQMSAPATGANTSTNSSTPNAQGTPTAEAPGKDTNTLPTSTTPTLVTSPTQTVPPGATTGTGQEQVPFEELLNPTVQRPLPAKHADAPVDPLQIKKTVQPPATTRIKHGQAKNYIGRYFIVVMNNKVERCGILKRVDANNIYVQRKWNNDSIEYTIRRDRIKAIDVLKQGQTPPACHD